MPVSFSFSLIDPTVPGATQPVTPSATSGASAERDFRLAPASDDLELVEGDLPMVVGAEGVASDLRSRLQTFTSEWFLDLDLGIPRAILGSKFQKGRIEQVYREAILETPGVGSLEALSISFEKRELRVAFRVVTDFGEIIEAVLNDTGA